MLQGEEKGSTKLKKNTVIWAPPQEILTDGFGMDGGHHYFVKAQGVIRMCSQSYEPLLECLPALKKLTTQLQQQ